ncbi:MAG: pyridoxal phosphate-dependent aminotransferase [Aquisalimonadaceae bacterium]
MSLPYANRLDRIEPFHVMELLARARELEAVGRDIVHMEVGEPDFPTAAPVVEAGIAALRAGLTGYSQACGLPALRQALAEHYRVTSGIDLDPGRIVVTPGASGALILAMGLLVNAGDRVLLPDPGYPCNRNFVRHVDGLPTSVPVRASHDFQPTWEELESRWQPGTVAAILGSPANPTGTVVPERTLASVHDWLHERGAALVVDEIYHGLVYGEELRSALAVRDSVFVVNSFSKYFGMTGWRLGWLVVPNGYQRAAEKLAQNLFIAASTPAQHAALACFTPEAHAIFEQRRSAFRERRDYLLEALPPLGFRLPVVPRGAFYLYADASGLSADSDAFCRQMLEQAGVAVTPGRDFGDRDAAQHVRFAYTTGLDRLHEGVERMRAWLQAG